MARAARLAVFALLVILPSAWAQSGPTLTVQSYIVGALTQCAILNTVPGPLKW